MLHGAVLRSPFAYARIISIDASAALQHPKVHAVLTGRDLEARNVAWVPTMSQDLQAVQPIDDRVDVRLRGLRARLVASAMLEVSAEDLEWERGRWLVKGDPEQGATIQEIAMVSRGSLTLPPGIEGGLDAEAVYDPRTAFDEEGNCLGGSLMDYLIPTAVEVPDWETDYTVTPSPHHPLGAKGTGESATVGSPPAIVNAVLDALAPYRIRHMDMPCTPGRVWDAIQKSRTP